MRKQGDTYLLDGGPVYLLSHGCCVGRKEGEGPLRSCFDYIAQEDSFGQASWEKAVASAGMYSTPGRVLPFSSSLFTQVITPSSIVSS